MTQFQSYNFASPHGHMTAFKHLGIGLHVWPFALPCGHMMVIYIFFLPETGVYFWFPAIHGA